MCEIVREMTREELITRNNELRAENERLYEELQEARLAVEHNGNFVEQERLRHELYRRDGEISGLRFAIRCITEGCRAKAVLDEVKE